MDRVDTLVIGAGVVGLAVARSLARAGREVIVLEATNAIGGGISSRNSEVIHAGIYYPKDSLKALACVQGKQLLYEYCSSHGVPHRRCGKLIVATDKAQVAELEGIAAELGHEGWPSDVTLLDVVVDLSLAVGDDEVVRVGQRIALERVGRAESPDPDGGLEPAERFVRSFVAVGDRFEDALAAELGDARARELHMARDGWPGVRMNTGGRCPK